MESSTPFSGSAGVYDWISGFINMERGQSFRSFRLDRMKIMAGIAGNPEKCAPSVHIAGSKGKGSVTGMIAAILNRAGVKCSLYASPHVNDFRERLSMGNSFFPEHIYSGAGNELKSIIDSLASRDSRHELFNSENENGEEPTFFELMTLWFFLCSRAAKTGAMAVETGMGGRLDATNILEPLVSVITLIELEHTEYLGSTIAAIAGEKAGIIKPERPVIIAEQKPEALEVFRKKALETRSRLLYFPEYGETNNIRLYKDGTVFSLKLKNPHNGKILSFDEIRLSIPGKIQAKNAGLAVLAVITAFPDISHNAIIAGLAGFSIPARFEHISTNPDFIIDGAHTSVSVNNTVQTFTELYGKGGVLIFGCAAGKDAAKMASILIPFFSKIIITTPGSFKKSTPDEVYKTFCEIRDNAKDAKKTEILFVPETEEAVKRTLELGRELNLPILGAGSFYLAAELRKSVGNSGSV